MCSWQAVFFDFDGVILATTHVKTEAFASMYRPHGQQIERAVVAYHRQHGGISRMIKLRYFEEQLLGRTAAPARIEALAAEFSRLTLEGVLAAPFVPGAEETLGSVARAHIPAFVISGTPTRELRHVTAARDLDRFFVEVNGSPPLKPEILLRILTEHRFTPHRCLFIGDALTDLEAASAVGVAFYAVEPPGERHLFPERVSVQSEVALPSYDADFVTRR